MTNRLKLDFKLMTTTERSDFVNKYITSPEFKIKPLAESELETLSNYILWGVDPITGLNGRQQGDFELKTKKGTWDIHEIESLEGLLDNANFKEGSLFELGQAPLTKKTREVFNRETELARAGFLETTLKKLFQQIDELEYQLNFYELEHGRRIKPSRPELVARLISWDSDFEKLEEQTTHWGQYLYLKHKHRIVELRREQYTLRDIYAPMVGTRKITMPITLNTAEDWGVGFQVFPLGLCEESSRLIFREFEELTPVGLGEKELKRISQLYWRGRNSLMNGDLSIDFRNAFHVQRFISLIRQLEIAAEKADFESNLGSLINTFTYYVRQANLGDVLADILWWKIEGAKNQLIAEMINKKYNKSYTVNYISTIYCQRILKRITDAAERHLVLVSNIFFEEEWKKCSGCGRLLLRDTENFTRKCRSKDGLSTRCKTCEKLARDSK